MTNDKQRERLVEILRKFVIVCRQDCEINEGKKCNECHMKQLSDLLLANGVIVPPFEIGTRVYAVITNMPFVRADVYECEVVWYALGKDGIRPTVEIKSDNIINGANLGLYLEDLFASREEAEQALVTDKNVGSKKEEGVE